MDDATVVSGGDGLGHLPDEGGRLPLGQRARLQARLETRAVHEGHRQEVVPVMLPDLKDRDDAGVVQRGGGLGFGVEAADLGVTGQLAG